MLYNSNFSRNLDAIKTIYPEYMSYTSLADNPLAATSYEEVPLPATADYPEDYPEDDAIPAVPGETALGDCSLAMEWIAMTAAAPRAILAEYPECLQVGDLILTGRLAWIGRVLRGLPTAAAAAAEDCDIWRRAAQRIHTDIRAFATDIVWLVPEDPRSPLNEDSGAEIVGLIADLLELSQEIYHRFSTVS